MRKTIVTCIGVRERCSQCSARLRREREKLGSFRAPPINRIRLKECRRVLRDGKKLIAGALRGSTSWVERATRQGNEGIYSGGCRGFIANGGARVLLRRSKLRGESVMVFRHALARGICS